MSNGTETVAFQAETKELLHLVIHSLYTNKEIFLRELISNASDALDKRRLEILRDSSFASDWEPEILLEREEKPRLLRIVDNGIGMTRDELVSNLGTIARSGTRQFLESLKQAEQAGEAPDLIGQFGVGFYSSFMVADEVRVVTRRLGEQDATRWVSKGDGAYTLEEASREEAGTTIELVLKDVDQESGQKDWTQEFELREVVKRYSDFVGYPVRTLSGAKEGEEPELLTLNSMTPLWTRPKSELEDDDYAGFYKQLAHDWNDPLETIHFKAEGTTEYTALLFLPKERPMSLFDPQGSRSRVQLYVRRVFIMDECEELVPVWLRFVPGIVDASDLPLNVSRETLQHNRQMGAIKKRLTRKVLDSLQSFARDRREDYAGFWGSFGPVLKEGLYYDDEHREELAKLCLFPSTRSGADSEAASSEESGEESSESPAAELVSLGEYVERMPVKQNEIYVLCAANVETAARSPHLEAFAARGYEVLFLVDPVDEFVLQRLTEFEGKPIRAIDQGEVDLEDEQEKEAREAREKEHADMLEAFRKHLAEDVETVRFSNRLSQSPACLVNGEHHLSAQMLRMMQDSGQPLPKQKRVLELNPEHPLVARLSQMHGDDAAFGNFSDWCELLYGQAQLAEGAAVHDPARFNQLLSELMLSQTAVTKE